MRVAISTYKREFSSPLWDTTDFIFLDMEDRQIINQRVMKSPLLHLSIPLFLEIEGVDCVVTNDMCDRAHFLFEEMGIKKMIHRENCPNEIINQLRANGCQFKDL
jgi:predicted Fe-Mo cluster-binding NifX family protein